MEILMFTKSNAYYDSPTSSLLAPQASCKSPTCQNDKRTQIKLFCINTESEILTST